MCAHTLIPRIMFLSAPNIYTDLHSIWVKCAGVWGKLYPNEMGYLHSVRRMYVTLKELIPQTSKYFIPFFCWLNVQVPGVKLSL